MSTEVSEASVVAKVCCVCAKIVSGRKRMRDTEGRYWCLACGKADEEKKRKALAAGARVACAGCYKPVPQSELREYGSSSYCAKCYAKNNRADGGGMMGGLLTSILPSGAREKRRVLILSAAMGILGVFGLVYYFAILPTMFSPTPSPPAPAQKRNVAEKRAANKPPLVNNHRAASRGK